jgi:hypothetical protein
VILKVEYNKFGEDKKELSKKHEVAFQTRYSFESEITVCAYFPATQQQLS